MDKMRSLSFTALAQLLDVDAIKTSIATAATAQSYTGAALDGAWVDAGHVATPQPNSHTGVAMYPVAVGSANAGSYVNGSHVTFTGTYGGEAVVRTATVSGTDGGTFIADGPIETVTAVSVDAQVNTGGLWTFGFTDICPRKRGARTVSWLKIRGGATGNIAMDFPGGSDVLPVTAGELMDVSPSRIKSSGTTATAFTVFELCG